MPIKSNFLSNNIVKTFNKLQCFTIFKILKQFFNQGKGMQVTPHYLKTKFLFLAFYSVLGFHFSHAIDESELNKLVGKKVQEALAKEKAKAKHQRVDKSAFLPVLAIAGCFHGV